MGAKRIPGSHGLNLGFNKNTRKGNVVPPALRICIPGINQLEPELSIKGSGVFSSLVYHYCLADPVEGYRAYLTKNQRWIVGPYYELRRLSIAWRNDDKFRGRLFELGVRIGRRGTDTAPQGDRVVKSFKASIKGKKAEASIDNLHNKFGSQRNEGKGQTVNEFQPRLTDQYSEAKKYFADQTLEAHHIVEKSILGALGVNSGELDNNVAPCVLIVAELHRRLFTSEVSRSRRLFDRSLSSTVASAELERVYQDLYKDPVFGDLMKISLLICRKSCSRLV